MCHFVCHSCVICMYVCMYFQYLFKSYYINIFQNHDVLVTYIVTGHPLSGLVRVQPGKLCEKYNVCGEVLESLTPLYKGRKTLWRR